MKTLLLQLIFISGFHVHHIHAAPLGSVSVERPLGECPRLNETDLDLCDPLRTDEDATCFRDDECRDRHGLFSLCCYIGCTMHCLLNDQLVHVLCKGGDIMYQPRETYQVGCQMCTCGNDGLPTKCVEITPCGVVVPDPGPIKGIKSGPYKEMNIIKDPDIMFDEQLESMVDLIEKLPDAEKFEDKGNSTKVMERKFQQTHEKVEKKPSQMKEINRTHNDSLNMTSTHVEVDHDDKMAVNQEEILQTTTMDVVKITPQKKTTTEHTAVNKDSKLAANLTEILTTTKEGIEATQKVNVNTATTMEPLSKEKDNMDKESKTERTVKQPEDPSKTTSDSSRITTSKPNDSSTKIINVKKEEDSSETITPSDTNEEKTSDQELEEKIQQMLEMMKGLDNNKKYSFQT